MDEFSKLNNINETANAVEGPLERYVEIHSRNVPKELMTYGKTYMMFVQTQHKLANMNCWYESRELNRYTGDEARPDIKT